MPDALRYAVVGHPVGHSRSPEIHAQFAAQCGIHLEYTRLDAKAEQFATVVANFFRDDGRGLNVTLPHKRAAARLATTLSPRAARAGVVNTLSRSDLAIAGDNTDGIGLVRDLARVAADRLALVDAAILVIGAGGAAQGAVSGLLDAGCRRLTVVARDATKARALLSSDRARGSFGVLDWHDRAAALRFDMVLNATAATVRGEALALQPAWFEGATLGYDLGYRLAGEPEPPFLAFARARGCALLADGLGMLVEQAAESFLVWHGVRPDVVPVLSSLRGR